MSSTRTKKPPSTVRCAIYTRKSTEKGLDQDFNTLDAQREACEAYITGHQHEGWLCLPERYDDGGYSGSTLKRPGFQRLLHDVDDGKIDLVICYKHDRISREVYESCLIERQLATKGVSIVSATEPIEGTDPSSNAFRNMIRVMAQLERELTAARTRDKMCAARRKGRWVGGIPVLGFDIVDKKLVVNETEAEQIRAIFGLYLRHKSLQAVCAELEHRGLTTKSWTTRKGVYHEGGPFTKSTLQRYLTNYTFIGKVNHGGEIYPGEHEAIVPTRTFNRVQKLIAENRRTNGGYSKNKYGFLLRGLVRCAACDSMMTPSPTRKRSKVYRYYVCSSAQRKGYKTCPCPSIPAQKLEDLIVDQIKAIGQDRALQRHVVKEARDIQAKQIAALEAKQQRHEKKLTKTQDEIAGVLQALAKGDVQGHSISDRLVVLEAKAGELGQKISSVTDEIDSLQQTAIDAHDLAEALTLFDTIWDVLYPSERARIIELLIDHIDFRGKDTPPEVDLSPAGIRLLASEIAEATEKTA